MEDIIKETLYGMDRKDIDCVIKTLKLVIGEKLDEFKKTSFKGNDCGCVDWDIIKQHLGLEVNNGTN